MRLSRRAIIGCCCLLGPALGATVGYADPMASPYGVAAGSGAAASAYLTPAPGPVTYDELRRRMHPMRLDSAAAARAAAATLDDRAIELQGQVRGVMSTSRGRNYLFQMDDATLLLAAPLDFNGVGLLNTGATVRVLATTAESAEAKACNADLTIIAARRTPIPSIVLSPAPIDDGGVKVAPPMTDMLLAGPSITPSRPDNSVDRETTNLPSLSEDEYEAQKPTYCALVRHFNNKLRDDQVDAIAGALLGAARASQIDPRFLASIIAVESSFDIYCLSSSGAMGLGQLMPFNVKEAGITNAWDPVQNIYGTARLLHGHLNDYRGRPDGTLLAVAAYNAGPGAVRRAGYRVPSGAQVQRYVWKVYYQYKALAPDMFNK